MAIEIEQTKAWIKQFVIDLNLCPFAPLPFQKDKIRYELFMGQSVELLANKFLEELLYLDKTDPAVVETSLLIFPNMLSDFYDYNEFLHFSQDLIFELQLDGVIQLASFHPSYQFEGTDLDEPGNFTNRSPWPMLHLLREDSVERAVNNYEYVEEISVNNQKLMKTLGKDHLMKMWNELRK